MGCLRRFLVVGIVLTQLASFAFTLLVFGAAGALGEAVILNSTDALVVFLLNGAALLATVVLVVVLWSGGRARRRQAREIAALRQAPPGPTIR